MSKVPVRILKEEGTQMHRQRMWWGNWGSIYSPYVRGPLATRQGTKKAWMLPFTTRGCAVNAATELCPV